MEILTAFAATGAPAFALTLARVSGVFLMSPVFSSRLIPVRAKLLVALGVTFAAVPFATGGKPVPDNIAEIAVAGGEGSAGRRRARASRSRSCSPPSRSPAG